MSRQTHRNSCSRAPDQLTDAQRYESNAKIGVLMGDAPEYGWRVMSGDESAYCLELTKSDCANPQREADDWLADFARRNPECASKHGYHVVKTAHWPDYLSVTADTARFINWALCDSAIAALGVVVRVRSAGIQIEDPSSEAIAFAPTLPMALATALGVLPIAGGEGEALS